MSNTSAFRELIRDAQHGDTSAVESLITQFTGVIRQECARYVSSLPPDLSQADLIQEVLLRVLTKIHQFKGLDSDQHTQAAFESWVRTSARSTLNNLYRNRNTKQRAPQNGMAAFDECAMQYHEHLPNQAGPSSMLVKDEELERLRDAMNSRLDDCTIEILNRYIVEGQSFRRICDEMSLSYDQVRYAFHTAQAHLRDWLS